MTSSHPPSAGFEFGTHSTSPDFHQLYMAIIVNAYAWLQELQLHVLRSLLHKYCEVSTHTASWRIPWLACFVNFPLNSKNTKISPTKRSCRSGCANHRNWEMLYNIAKLHWPLQKESREIAFHVLAQAWAKEEMYTAYTSSSVSPVHMQFR